MSNNELKRHIGTYNGKTQRLITLYDWEYVAQVIPLETLVDSYVAHQSPRGGAAALKKSGLPEKTIKWCEGSPDVIPVYHSGSRDGEPTAEDVEMGIVIYSRDDEGIQKALDHMGSYVPHDYTVEDIRENLEDGAATLAALHREFRLAVERESKAKRALV